MFKRVKKQKLHVRLKKLFWPSIGWRRSISYLFLRLSRLPGSAYSIASGFACGAAISFTPFVGLHFILGAIWAWLIRGNIFAAILGTAIGNPWTFPFIWMWIYKTGCFMHFDKNNPNIQQVNFAEIFSQIYDSLLSAKFALIVELSFPILWPMLLGTLPTMVFVWILFYLVLIKTIRKYQG